ncbi:hypothetical protein ACFFOM_11790 [Microlunatus capsulatus]|uniref:Galactose mutarotase-like enzyme n=1 Tax=Microlunatus capsulatus TaxID=99117 RepID=A0ABS4Z936_9ACTN|nr:hypothetical protein [Microlunatus capsulatus]MBP2417572.1 galactose mutarotase-like enzyme [Microlunatus capsulatus]
MPAERGPAPTSGARTATSPTSPTLSTEWSLSGHPAVVLENRWLRAVVLPALGAKVVSLVDKRADLELLWRNGRVPLRAVPTGAVYDDHFSGGWDEMFPNDEPEELAGELMPDHGELWTQPWAVSTGTSTGGGGPEVVLDLAVSTPVSACRAERRLVLGDGPELRCEYRVTNEGRRALPFLWKSHVAVALQPDTTVDMAAREVLVDGFGAPRVRPAGAVFSWPVARVDGQDHDFRRRPDINGRGVAELLVATGLDRGACAVDHPAAGSGLALGWDAADLPSCWLFASHGGGWRGHDVLVLEPCTGHPLSVADGAAAGTHQVLEAGATRSWSLTAAVGRPAPLR